MTKPFNLFVLCVACFALTALSAVAQDEPKEKTRSGNPVFPGWYADPEGVIFDDTYWIFPTTSARYRQQLYFDCFSSPDLVNWTKHERVLDNQSIQWAEMAMWAPSVVEKDG